MPCITTCGPRRSRPAPNCAHHADPQTRWPEFRRRYLEELRGSQAVREFVRRIAGNETVTLLYASKNAAENHALVLQEFLEHAVTEIAHA